MENEKIIGIPRGMSFYNNYPFYYGFFNDLDIKIMLSDVTTKQTMSVGSSLVVPETCLPVKVYVGHILNLLDKGIDKIFVPSKVKSLLNMDFLFLHFSFDIGVVKKVKFLSSSAAEHSYKSDCPYNCFI